MLIPQSRLFFVFLVMLTTCLVGSYNGVAQNQGWDVSNSIEGEVIDIVTLYPTGVALLTDEDEVGWYAEDNSNLEMLTDGIADVKVFNEVNNDSMEDEIDVFSYSFKELGAADGRGFYLLTDERMAFYIATDTKKVTALPLIERLDGSIEPFVPIHTMSKPGDEFHDYVHTAVEAKWGDLDYLYFRLFNYIELEYSNEFRRAWDVSWIENATTGLSFDGSHMSGRNCFFAWDNTNRKLLMLDFSKGTSGFEVISYDDLPIDISDVEWMSTVKDMRYFDDERYRLSNGFIFIKDSEGKLFKYWFHSGSLGFSEYGLKNHSTVGGLNDRWAVWFDISSDFDNVDVLRLGSFTQTYIFSEKRNLIFPIKNSDELLKYDIITGGYCYISMRDWLQSGGFSSEPIRGGINAYNRLGGLTPLVFFYTEDKIYSIENKDLFQGLNCNETSSLQEGRQKDLDLIVYRIDNRRVRVEARPTNAFYDHAEIYRVDGLKVHHLPSAQLNSNPIIDAPLSSMYFIVGFKDGKVVSTKKFF